MWFGFAIINYIIVEIRGKYAHFCSFEGVYYMDNPYFGQPCPVAKALDLISGKWKVLILYQLSFGGHRYNELKRQIFGITNTVLSRCLRELQQDGLVLRKDYDKNPPHTEYFLSEFGKTLLPVLHEIRRWADENMQDKQPDELLQSNGREGVSL